MSVSDLRQIYYILSRTTTDSRDGWIVAWVGLSGRYVAPGGNSRTSWPTRLDKTAPTTTVAEGTGESATASPRVTQC